MKHIFSILMTIVMGAVICGMPSCSKDDDGNGGSGKGMAWYKVNGKSFDLKYGYTYAEDGDLILDFYSFDAYELFNNPEKLPTSGTCSYFGVLFEPEAEGEIWDYHVWYGYDFPIKALWYDDDEIDDDEEDLLYGNAILGDIGEGEDAPIYVTKNGSKYVIEGSKVPVDIYYCKTHKETLGTLDFKVNGTPRPVNADSRSEISVMEVTDHDFISFLKAIKAKARKW